MDHDALVRVEGDPLDLPLFASAATRQGRVRSSFVFPDLHAAASTAAGAAPGGGQARPPLAVVPSARTAPARPRRAPAGPPVDWSLVAVLRSEVSQRLSDAMGEQVWDRAEQERQGWLVIRRVLDEDTATSLARDGQVRSLAEQEALVRAVFDAVFRLGRLQPLVDDERVENIVITGADRVVVEYADGTFARVAPVADTDEELAEFLAFLAARSEDPRSFSTADPALHLTLEDGSRLAADRDTARISAVIRRHRIRQVTLADLVSWGSLSPVAASFLRAAVRARKSIVISGSQGAGKTTFLRALCAEIDPWESVGTFETERELFLHEMPDQHYIVHAWQARPGSGERGADGRAAGARSIADQVVDSFRFYLGRQIQGEIRGPEVWSMIKLMESGSGSISTTHAANARAAMRKLVTCAMEAGPSISQELAAAKLADTVDVVVHLACDIVRNPTGGSGGRKNRYVEEILEVTPGERDRGIATQPIFRRVPGRCAVANLIPDSLIEDLLEHGFDLAGFERELALHRRDS